MKNAAIVAWSGGKDSSLALNEVLRQGEIEVAALLTTVTEGYDRISMHGVRRDLLAEQAKALGYPLDEVGIPQQCTNEIYEQRMQDAMEKYHRDGIEQVIFGDLFLQDVRSYREERLGRIGMRAVFPLWGRNTAELARDFIRQGFRAVLVCVDTNSLTAEFAGREYDETLLNDLPANVDPCGENGEFHTFVYAGPIFQHPLRIEKGTKVLREERFCYCDLLSAASSLQQPPHR